MGARPESTGSPGVGGDEKVMRFAMDNDLDSSYDLEAQLQGSLVGTADNDEGIAAFLQKRKPEFKGKK